MFERLRDKNGEMCRKHGNTLIRSLSKHKEQRDIALFIAAPLQRRTGGGPFGIIEDSSTMIVQEHIEGIRGNDLAAIDNAGLDRRCSPYDPEFRLIERVKPFIDRAMRERYQPVETARRAQQTLSDLFGLVTSMPRDLARLVKDARHGRLRVDLDLKRLDRFGDRVHSAMDRATIGIMTASLVVGSSIVMTIAEGPRLFGVSLLTYCGLVGYLVAFVNSLWIIFSIWRSSRR